METTVSERLDFSLVPKTLDSGSPEERSCFGMLSVRMGDSILTEGVDRHSAKSSDGPSVSGYHFAEWLAWNWWRLRWEWWFRPASEDDLIDSWDFAHRMSTIGEGYVWPNITIASDGYQTALVSDRSEESRAAFRFFGAPITLISATSLETAIDRFVSSILTRLDDDGIHRTNLHGLWNELTTERELPETAFFRRMEAHLGHDPDELDQVALSARWLADAERLGKQALAEMATHAAYSGVHTGVISADYVTEIANQHGFDAGSRDAVELDPPETDLKWGNVEAWRIGEDCARRLHLQEGLDAEQPISNRLLATMAGVSERVILDSIRVGEMSFFLDNDGSEDRVVLRSSGETGRRFSLARILGDRLFGWKERLFPATRSYSYRQKAQRAFAAELLSPFEAVDNMLGADDSEDRQHEIAQYYNVSPITIGSMLVNKGRISREEASGIVSPNYFR